MLPPLDPRPDPCFDQPVTLKAESRNEQLLARIAELESALAREERISAALCACVLRYRVAAMEALQRCTPLPFTEGLGGAVAGRILTVPFRTRKRPPKTEERRAWLPQKIL